ncbi:MAG: helix-turn-helix domain-containing protein [Candidatus Brocadiales bacterium]
MTERDRITELLFERKTISEIAKALGRHKSTISRELKRNSSPARELYLSRRAQFGADQRRTTACCRPRFKNNPTRMYVQEKLMIGWVPPRLLPDA